MADFPADPYSDRVTPFPAWAVLPRQSMATVWTELHRSEKTRHDMLVRLKKIDVRAWLPICRDKACVGIDVEKWLPVITLLACDTSLEHLKEAIPIARSTEDDAYEMAKKVLHDAVRGVLEIDDAERVKAAHIILRMGPTKSTNNNITIVTGVPNHEDTTTQRAVPSGVCGLPQDCGVGASGEGGSGGGTESCD